MEQFPASEDGRKAKATANREMFDRIARRYDTLNRLVSLGLDRRWRRRLVDLCGVGERDRCLDLCCGTGDVARELARRGAEVVALDASAEMLALAERHSSPDIRYLHGDALQLPFPDDSFDAVTIAFGNRNVASLTQLYAEMRRVARPGGRVASLEIHTPTSRWLAPLFGIYFRCIPTCAAFLLGVDTQAYGYLTESVRQYPSAETVASMMREIGIAQVRIEHHLGGIIAIHHGIA